MPLEGFEKYKAWIAAGFHANMDYLARPSSLEKRQNPKLLFPAIKTILVLGIPYVPTVHTEAYSIASYAQGPDYHDLIPERLKDFPDWLASLVEHPVHMRIFTDTAPVLEKELAVRAGLGWRGKNGLMLNPQYGSFFFLTEIFMDLKLLPDEPFTKDMCGTCTRCIDNCPTGCIQPDRTLNAAKCLSYLTIEMKGSFSEQEMALINDSIFGCDVCQTVCPWNQKLLQQEISRPLFQPDIGLAQVSPDDLLKLDDETFREKYRNTPIYRTKRAGLIRNILASITNHGSSKDIPILEAFIAQEENENLRMMAIHAQAKLTNRLNYDSATD